MALLRLSGERLLKPVSLLRLCAIRTKTNEPLTKENREFFQSLNELSLSGQWDEWNNQPILRLKANHKEKANKVFRTLLLARKPNAWFFQKSRFWVHFQSLVLPWIILATFFTVVQFCYNSLPESYRFKYANGTYGKHKPHHHDGTHCPH
ncbi:hypothetical protein Ddc_08888 [Ditylenchus destructor]|nr:hypothetical protein Ddc_08888 [Ditylenchus destructor]